MFKHHFTLNSMKDQWIFVTWEEVEFSNETIPDFFGSSNL